MSIRIARLAQACGISALVALTSASAAPPQVDPNIGALRFGGGLPFGPNDLPPGQLRNRLQSLPPQASARALKWLNEISFTGTDLDVLRLDDQGGVYFADTVLPDPALTPKSGLTTDATPQSTLDGAFVLHSRPGSSKRVYLDFTGHTFTNTAWSSGTLVGRPYDLDGTPGTFNNTERTKIVDIWHRVAEDLAPFDIDVTTEEPASFNANTGRILITTDTDANGVAMPSQGAGGVAYVNVFGQSNYHTFYSPALVYFNNLGGGFETYVAEASSHEFGHNLGLSHDGTATVTYYSGHGTGLVSWAPIMGVGYYNNVTEWSKGEYAGANQTQDDVAIVTAKLAVRPDDHGNGIATGTPLFVAGDGTVVATNPEFDPANTEPDNKGVIGSTSDVDVFTFIAGAGTVNLTVRPAYDAFYRASDKRGANLDIQAELRDVGGNLVASSDPTDDTQATVNAAVAAGTYHLLVSGVGNATVPYSDYGSLGMYFVNGTMAPATPDTNAPTPNPMTWASLPQALDSSSIAMTASTATDDISNVQYRFHCVSGGAGCTDSAWQAGTSYTATGLAANTQYTYTVSARDSSGNATAPSASASATTAPPPPWVDFVASADGVVAGSVSGTYASTQSDNGTAQTITEVQSGGKPQSRYSYLEHRWNFSIGLGATATVVANAWSGGSSDGDTFDFQYSLNGGGSWTTMFNVSSTSTGNSQSFVLPGTPSGAVLLRVADTNRVAGAVQLNTVSVDHLYIRVANASGDPPDGNPSGMSANAVSSSRIDLAWTDNASNESNYRLERSPNGSSGWTVVANLAANSQSYSDTGLTASTQYFYRVSAYNTIGSSGYATANATTTAAPPLTLSASGTKVKAVAIVNLTWSGASPVDVYRNGSLIASGVNGTTYSDNTGVKGAPTFTHQVCVAGGTSTCSNVTTTVF